MKFNQVYDRLQMKFAKVMFLQVSVILSMGGACMVAHGGGGGGVHGCSGKACVVAPTGGMHGCSGGDVHGCSGGCVWLLREGRGGGMHGCSGGVCVVFQGGMHGFFDEIWSMSGRYTSYWNAFLLTELFSQSFEEITKCRQNIFYVGNLMY